ncbi:hypothetical protein [Powai lake megavirus]|uniref:Uncharacterized protein n=1 Tax=Powai lake megavirus TaxID=1842663 RepID=A0A167RIW5_9VIRU|nr:hypothetical protein QJ849_gp574 [Powai lake megavirus]ANB50736.1 hypothetical protein [Powai lake megavirus]
MIKLNTPVIKEEHRPAKNRKSLNRQYPINTIHDISTRSLFSVIYGDVDSQLILAKIISLIEPWIYLHTNVKLVDHGHLPLIGQETINLISRGKYILDYYYRQEKKNNTQNDNIFKNILEKIFNIDDNESNIFLKNYSKYFNASNMSFDLNIKTDNVNRFEIIEKYSVESMIEIIDIMTDNFDILLDHSEDLEQIKSFFRPISSAYNDVNNINIDYDSNELNYIKNIMSKPYFDYSANLMIHPDPKNTGEARKNNYKLINDISQNLDKFMDKTDDLMFFPYIYYFTKLCSKNISTLTSGITKFNVAIKNEINKYFIILADRNLYNNDSKHKLFSVIVSDLSKINSNTYYLRNTDVEVSNCNYTDKSLYDTVVLSRRLHQRDIQIIPRNSVYIYNGEKGTESVYIDGINEKKHNIVFDQSLAQVTRLGTYVTDYDTLKVDLNLTLRDTKYNELYVTYPIVANFINIRIQRINSSTYITTVDKPHIFINYLEDKNIYIKSYDRKTLVYNLIENIFNSDHYLPWYLINYDKSMIKLLFLLSTEQHNYILFLKKLLESPNKKQLVNYSMFYCFDYQSYSFYNLIWIEPNIHHEYYEIEYIIKFIIIMDELIKLSDDELDKIFSDFNISYGWCSNDSSVTEIKNSYALFRKKLLDIVNALYVAHE